MRLFVAVEISDEARRAAAAAAERLRSELGRAVTARWVPPENAHLTVRFIGHVTDERVATILDALGPPVLLPAFDVALGDCGVFPRSGPPRVIWIGLSEGLPALAALHGELDRRLAQLGFAAETRPFSAHLTLARVKAARASLVRRVVSVTTVPPIRFRVSSATLFESTPSPHGSTYRALLTVQLQTDNL